MMCINMLKRRMRMRRWLGVFAMIVLIAASIPALAEEKPLYPIRENGLWGYMNRQGETVIPAQWGQTWPFDGDTALVSTFQHDMYMDIFGDGLIDRNGNYLIEPREHVLIENDRYAYRICDENEPDCEGFYDKASGFYLPPQPQYKYVMLWGEDGKGPVAVENAQGFTGYLDRTTGETAIPFRYTGDSDDVCFRNGYARPADEIIVVDAVGHELAMGTQMHLIDGLGRELTFENGISPISTVFNGRFIYSATNPVSEETEDQEPDDGDAYLGNGEKIIPPYNSIDALTGEKTEMPDWYTSSNEDSFAGLGIAAVDGTMLSEPNPDLWHIWEPDSDGMLCILADTESGSLCGHMDLDGNVIVPPRYDILTGGSIPRYSFSNGYAVIENWEESDPDSSRWVILDTAGNEIFSRPGYGADDIRFFLDDGGVLEDGLLWYSIKKTDETGGHAWYGYFGLMKIQDGKAEFLTEPVFEQHIGGIIQSEDLSDRVDFAEGLHPVRINGQWGYINKRAEMVIQPVWDEAASFHDGLALVEKNGKLSYIDHDGSVVWQEK